MRRPFRDPTDRELLWLALPAFGSLVAEPLYLLGDAAVVGTLGTEPLAGLGAAATVLTTVVGLCVFLAYSTTAVTARLLGAGNLTRALHRGIDGMWLGVGLGVLLLLVGVLTAEPVVRALGASQAVVPYASAYLRISALGLPAMLLVLAATGVLRGLQDTRTPLVVAVVSATANFGLAALFVLGFDWGIEGSAWATVIAQTGAAACFVIVVGHGAARHHASWVPDLGGVLAAGTTSLPLFVRTIALRMVFLTAAAVAARLGDADLAAYQVSMQTWFLLALGMDALAIAGQAVVGKRLGGGDVDGAHAVVQRLVGWSLGLGVLLLVVVVALREPYASIFTDDADVAALLAASLVVVALMQPLAGPVFVWDGILIGAGDAGWLAWAQIVMYAAFLPAAWLVLEANAGLVALWWALFWFMAERGLLLWWRTRSSAWAVPGAVR
ncbi:MAG: MATE family efflux transporter [Candidatus Nanopelagicales bacterium]